LLSIAETGPRRLPRSGAERHRDGGPLVGALDVELAARLGGVEVGDPQPDALAVLERGLGAGLEDPAFQVGDTGAVVDDLDPGPGIAAPDPDRDLGFVGVVGLDGVLEKISDRVREVALAGKLDDGGVRGVDPPLEASAGACETRPSR